VFEKAESALMGGLSGKEERSGMLAKKRRMMAGKLRWTNENVTFHVRMSPRMGASQIKKTKEE
jgi:hypothetical protein